MSLTKRRAYLAIFMLAVVGALVMAITTTDRRAPPHPGEARTSEEADEDEDTSFRRRRTALDVPGEIVRGRVFLRRPDGDVEGVPANLRSLLVDRADDETYERLVQVPGIRCSSDGSFILETVGKGTLICSVQHEDGVTAFLSGEIPAQDEMTIEMLPAGKVEVRLPGNQSVFEVLLVPGNGSASSGRGPIRIEGFGAGVLCGGIPLSWDSVKASVLWPNGGRTDVADPVELKFREWAVITIDKAVRSGSISGRIVDRRGAPIARASGFLSLRGGREIGQREGWNVESAQDGTFRLAGVPAGEFALQLRREDYVPWREELFLAEGDILDLGQIVLLDGAKLRGRVAHLEPADAHKAIVSLKNATARWDHLMTNGDGSTELDEEGRFAFSGVTPGEWIVAVSPERPRLNKTAWSGRYVTVREEDVDVLVPDLSLPDPSRIWSATLDHRLGKRAFLRALARGIDRPWATFGAVSDDGLVEMSIGEGRFRFGVITENPRYIRWLGVMSRTDTYLEAPRGSIVLVSEEGFDGSSLSLYTVSVVYVAGTAWPRDLLPLNVGSAPVNEKVLECHIGLLQPGTYDIRIQRGMYEGSLEIRSVIAEVPRGGSVRLPWPYRP